MAVILGWLVDVRDLKNLIPNHPVVAANCSIGWTLISLSVLFNNVRAKWGKYVGIVSALTAIILAAILIYGGFSDQTFDWISFQLSEESNPVELPGQMLYQESVPIFLLGCASLFSHAPIKLRRYTQPVLILLATLPAVQALIGYITANANLFTFCTATHCARLHIFTAFTNVALCALLLFIQHSLTKEFETAATTT